MSSKSSTAALSKPSGSFTSVPTTLLQRKCACGGSPGMAGACTECQQKKLTGQTPPLIQPKLTISQPNDKYEQEADRVADMVMRMPEPKIQREMNPQEDEDEETIQTKSIANTITPLVQRQAETDEEEDEELLQTKHLARQLTPLVQRETMVEEEDEDEQEALQRQTAMEEQDEEEVVQAKGATAQALTVTPPVDAAIQDMRQGGGQPLDPATRAFMEPRFGQDFSNVRIHKGHRAELAAQSVNARAFTVGRDVVFGSGEYTPRTRDGQQLIAHELTHMFQQRASIARMPTNAMKKSAPGQRLLSNGKRPKGFLGWWLRYRVPKGFRILTARRVSRAKRLLSGEFDLTVEERRMLLDLVGRGGAKASDGTPEQSALSTAEQEGDKDESIAEAEVDQQDRDEEAAAEEDSWLNGPYSTPAEAAQGFAEKYNPISKLKNEEVCSVIVEKKGQFFFLDGWQATEAGKRTHSCPSYPPSSRERRKPRNFAGQLHTHGGADPRYKNEIPSRQDRELCRSEGGPCFLVTPSDRVMQYGPDPAPRSQQNEEVQRQPAEEEENDRLKAKVLQGRTPQGTAEPHARSATALVKKKYEACAETEEVRRNAAGDESQNTLSADEGDELKAAKRTILILMGWLKRVRKQKIVPGTAKRSRQTQRWARRASRILLLNKAGELSLSKDDKQTLRKFTLPSATISARQGHDKRGRIGGSKAAKEQGQVAPPPMFDPCAASTNTLNARSFAPVDQSVLNGLGDAGRVGAVTAVEFPIVQFQQRDVFSVTPDPSQGMVMLDILQDSTTWSDLCERDRRSCEQATGGERFTNRTISGCKASEKVAREAGYVGVDFRRSDCDMTKQGTFFEACTKFRRLESTRIVTHEQGHIDAACWLASRANEKLQGIWSAVFEREKNAGSSASVARQAADKARVEAFVDMRPILRGGSNAVGLAMGLNKVWRIYDAETGHGCKLSEQNDWTGQAKMFKRLDATLTGIDNPFIDIEVPR